MIGFILRRLVMLVGVVFCVVTITFLLIRLAPGGPFDKDRKIPKKIEEQLLLKYQLDGPEGRALGEKWGVALGFSQAGTARLGEAMSLGQQYVSYVGDVARGDLRISTKYLNRSVNELLGQTLPVSMVLGGTAFLIAAGAGITLGAWAAVRANTWLDRGAMLAALFAISIPTFVVGPILVLLLALKLKIFPVGGWGTPMHLLLPAVTLAGPYIAYVARLMRTSMLEVLGQDFICTARAKGLDTRKVVYRHALKAAILPVISFLGPLAANLLTGSIIVETIFSIPGAGGFFVNSVLNRDGFLLGGVVIVYCLLLVVLNLVVDILYSLLDRRIKLYE